MKKYFLVLIVLALAGANSFAQDEPASDTVWTKVMSNRVNAVEFSPDGQFIYVAANDRPPLKVETATGEILKEYEGFLTPIFIDVTSDGRYILASYWASNKDSIFVWDTQAGELVKIFDSNFGPELDAVILSFSVSYDSKYVMANVGRESEFGRINEIVIWDFNTGEIIHNYKTNTRTVLFSPDNIHYVLGEWNVENNEEKPSKIFIYEIGTWEINSEFGGQEYVIRDMAFSKDGRYLITCSRGDSIKLWDITQKELKDHIPAHDNVHSVCFIDDVNIASSGKSFPFIESEIKITNINSNKTIKQFSMISGTDLDSKNNLLAVAYSTNLILLDLGGYLSATEEIDFEGNLKIIPNPVTSLSEIKFYLPAPGKVNIKILNTLGLELEEIYNGFLDIGSQCIPWYPKNLPNGSYLCSIQCGDYEAIVKLILQR